MDEIWKAIPGHPNYEASTLGRIRSLDWPDGRRGRVLKPIIQSNGYIHVTLTGRKQCRLHRVILLTFVGPSDLEVNHKNGVKTDNRLENLEYSTHQRNLKHALDTGLRIPSFGEKHYRAKLSDKDVEEIRNSDLRVIDLSKKFKVNRNHIYRIKKGLRRRRAAV